MVSWPPSLKGTSRAIPPPEWVEDSPVGRNQSKLTIKFPLTLVHLCNSGLMPISKEAFFLTTIFSFVRLFLQPFHVHTTGQLYGCVLPLIGEHLWTLRDWILSPYFHHMSSSWQKTYCASFLNPRVLLEESEHYTSSSLQY